MTFDNSIPELQDLWSGSLSSYLQMWFDLRYVIVGYAWKCIT